MKYLAVLILVGVCLADWAAGQTRGRRTGQALPAMRLAIRAPPRRASPRRVSLSDPAPGPDWQTRAPRAGTACARSTDPRW